MEGAVLPLCFVRVVFFVFFSKPLLEGLFFEKEKKRKGEEKSEGEFVPENNSLRGSSLTKTNKGAI